MANLIVFVTHRLRKVEQTSGSSILGFSAADVGNAWQIPQRDASQPEVFTVLFSWLFRSNT